MTQPVILMVWIGGVALCALLAGLFRLRSRDSFGMGDTWLVLLIAFWPLSIPVAALMFVMNLLLVVGEVLRNSIDRAGNGEGGAP